MDAQTLTYFQQKCDDYLCEMTFMKIILAALTVLLSLSFAFGQTEKKEDIDPKLLQALTDLAKDAQNDFAAIRGKEISNDKKKIVYEVTKNYFKPWFFSVELSYDKSLQIHELKFSLSALQKQGVAEKVKNFFEERLAKEFDSIEYENLGFRHSFSFDNDEIANMEFDAVDAMTFIANSDGWKAVADLLRAIENMEGLKRALIDLPNPKYDDRHKLDFCGKITGKWQRITKTAEKDAQYAVFKEVFSLSCDNEKKLTGYYYLQHDIKFTEKRNVSVIPGFVDAVVMDKVPGGAAYNSESNFSLYVKLDTATVSHTEWFLLEGYNGRNKVNFVLENIKKDYVSCKIFSRDSNGKTTAAFKCSGDIFDAVPTQ